MDTNNLKQKNNDYARLFKILKYIALALISYIILKTLINGFISDIKYADSPDYEASNMVMELFWIIGIGRLFSIDSTPLEMYYDLGFYISIINIFALCIFYPDNQHKNKKYTIKLRILNILGILSFPALWQFLFRLYVSDNLHLFEYLMAPFTFPEESLYLTDASVISYYNRIATFTFMSVFPVIIMSLMGLFYKNKKAENVEKEEKVEKVERLEKVENSFTQKQIKFQRVFCRNLIWVLLISLFVATYFDSPSDNIFAPIVSIVNHIFGMNSFLSYDLTLFRFLREIVSLSLIIKIADYIVLFRHYKKSDTTPYKMRYRVLNVLSIIATPFTAISLIGGFYSYVISFENIDRLNMKPLGIVLFSALVLFYLISSLRLDLYGICAPVKSENTHIKPKYLISSIICVVVFSVTSIFVSTLYFPTELDEIIYGDSFKDTIYENSIDIVRERLDMEFNNIYGYNLDDSTPAREYTLDSVDTDGYFVYTYYIVKDEMGMEYVFEFCGRRIWIGHYDWHLNTDFYEVVGIEW